MSNDSYCVVRKGSILFFDAGFIVNVGYKPFTTRGFNPKNKILGGVNLNSLLKIVSGIGILIGIYLFLSRSDGTSKIISVIAENSVKGISTLQGR